MTQEKFIKNVVDTVCEFRQNQEAATSSIDDWKDWCFETYYFSGSTGQWFFDRIAQGLTAMVNDARYKVSETELTRINF